MIRDKIRFAKYLTYFLCMYSLLLLQKWHKIIYQKNIEFNTCLHEPDIKNFICTLYQNIGFEFETLYHFFDRNAYITDVCFLTISINLFRNCTMHLFIFYVYVHLFQNTNCIELKIRNIYIYMFSKIKFKRNLKNQKINLLKKL